MTFPGGLGSGDDACIDRAHICEDASETSTDVQVVLDGLRSAVTNLQRQLVDESGKRLALTALVNTNTSEVHDLKNALNVEVKARCAEREVCVLPPQQSSVVEAAKFAADLAQTELEVAMLQSRIAGAEDLAKRALDMCECIGSCKDEHHAYLSTEDVQEIISLEKEERRKADEDLRKSINNRLNRERSERQQSDYAHLDELNAMFDEHLENYFAEKERESKNHSSKNDLEKTKHIIVENNGAKPKEKSLLDKGRAMKNLTHIVLVTLFMIFIACVLLHDAVPCSSPDVELASSLAGVLEPPINFNKGEHLWCHNSG